MASVTAVCALVLLLSVFGVCRASDQTTSQGARDLVLTLSDWTRHAGSTASASFDHRPANSGSSRRWSPSMSFERIDRLIVDCCRVHAINPNLMRALIRAESAFRPDAVSSAGAIGLCQLMPATALELGVDPWDPEQNVAGGARYLRSLLDEFGSLVDALIGYNAGPEIVRARRGVPLETAAYIHTVLRLFREYEDGYAESG